jgi:hypothetical protein
MSKLDQVASQFAGAGPLIDPQELIPGSASTSITTSASLLRIAGSMNSTCSLVLRIKPSTAALRMPQAP